MPMRNHAIVVFFTVIRLVRPIHPIHTPVAAVAAIPAMNTRCTSAEPPITSVEAIAAPDSSTATDDSHHSRIRSRSSIGVCRDSDSSSRNVASVHGAIGSGNDDGLPGSTTGGAWVAESASASAELRIAGILPTRVAIGGVDDGNREFNVCRYDTMWDQVIPPA